MHIIAFTSKKFLELTFKLAENLLILRSEIVG